jgi:transposase-like protein
MARTVSKEDEAARLQAYHATETDSEAARMVSMSQMGFRLWRVRQGLPAKSDGRTLSKEEFAARRKVLRESKTVAEAARRLGVTTTAIRNWGIKHGEHPGPEAIELPTPELNGPEDERRYAVWTRSQGDEEAARMLAITRHEFVAWRHHLGLPPPRDAHLARLDRARRALYEKGATDAEVAEALGVTVESAQKWRHAHMPHHGNPKADG